jgi:GDP-4-dehydro-6-deoxy-D-mannose reductase
MAQNRLLVTGASGFLGRWTLRHWRAAHPEVEVWATSDQDVCLDGLSDRYSVVDLRDASAVSQVVLACNPTHVIHLAGLIGEASLAEHLSVNVIGTDNLYSALAELDCSESLRIVQAGTAAIYGRVAPDELPISEKNAFRPLTAYAMSKMAQDYLAQMVWRTPCLGVIRARIFNLVGPNQPEHLVPATFIRQLKAGCEEGSLQVGNLETRRDFVDVRDVVLALDRLMTDGRSGEAYNIASGASTAIRTVLNELINIAGLCGISITQEAERHRKSDVSDVYADITAITEATGWRPRIPLRTSLEDMYCCGQDDYQERFLGSTIE